jgi:hypothetical protein
VNPIRLSLALVLALAAFPAAAVASADPAEAPLQVSLPAPTGRYEVGTRAIELTDRSRRDTPGMPGARRLMVQVTYPRAEGRGRCRPADYISPQVMPLLAEAVGLDRTGEILTGVCRGGPIAGGERPILVFSHAFTADRSVYGVLVNDLASRGYVVLAIDHPPDAFAVEYPGGELLMGDYGRPLAAAPATAEELGALNQLRAADARFVLTQAERLGAARRGFLSGHVDRRRVGILGHSLGGSTATRVAQVDRRIDAAVDLDGSLFGDWVAKTGDNTPFMLLAAEGGIGSDLAGQSLCGYMAGLTGPRFAFVLADAMHFSYSDFQALAPRIAAVYPEWAYAGLYQAVVGTIPPNRSVSVQRRTLAAFLGKYVKGTRAQRPRPIGPYSPIPLGDCG